MNTETYEPKWLLVLKGLIRPITTFLFVNLYIYVILKHNEFNKDVIDNLTNIVWLVLLFWYGERAVRNMGIIEFLFNKKNVNNNETNNTNNKNTAS